MKVNLITLWFNYPPYALNNNITSTLRFLQLYCFCLSDIHFENTTVIGFVTNKPLLILL